MTEHALREALAWMVDYAGEHGLIEYDDDTDQPRDFKHACGYYLAPDGGVCEEHEAFFGLVVPALAQPLQDTPTDDERYRLRCGHRHKHDSCLLVDEHGGRHVMLDYDYPAVGPHRREYVCTIHLAARSTPTEDHDA